MYKTKSEVKTAPKVEQPVVVEAPKPVEKPPQKEEEDEEEDSLTGGLDDWFQQAETSSGSSSISTSVITLKCSKNNKILCSLFLLLLQGRFLLKSGLESFQRMYWQNG